MLLYGCFSIYVNNYKLLLSEDFNFLLTYCRVSGGRMLMSRPGARLGLIAYLLFVHLWLLVTVVWHSPACSHLPWAMACKLYYRMYNHGFIIFLFFRLVHMSFFLWPFYTYWYSMIYYKISHTRCKMKHHKNKNYLKLAHFYTHRCRFWIILFYNVVELHFFYYYSFLNSKLYMQKKILGLPHHSWVDCS